MDEKRFQELTDAAATKALEDEGFRKELLKDANATIKKEWGEELPKKVTYHETTDKKLVFILPGNEELDDAILDNVSGGLIGNSGRQSMIASTMVMSYAAFPSYAVALPLDSKSGAREIRQ